ncbi:hypothetical protein HUK38_09105 [Thiospirillum jenense]|uniref:Uncharacterized protein n=1 Tax=Thiospirillum jenense TaxID=1653858 RepID=A0A839HE45_9GAMM|nr:hypothetical protein [Thiospirillum jenense]
MNYAPLNSWHFFNRAVAIGVNDTADDNAFVLTGVAGEAAIELCNLCNEPPPLYFRNE